MAEVTGKRIVVVGATGGLGSEIARKLSTTGANLVLVGRSAEKLQALGIAGEMLTTDLAAPGAADALISHIAQSGPIDGVVIAHGVVAFGTAAELDDATLVALVTLNQITPMQIVRSSIAPMRAAKAAGSEPFIVTISGIVAETPTVGLAAYSASKAGLAAFMSVMRRELRREGILALDARPPHTETELSKHPIAGTAPAFGPGLTPAAVADRIVAAIVAGETDLPSGAFS